ncbi:hypothetical protein [Nitrosococcus wardiae]|uniref:hypothetical protein n=1 Tax=Nitrosococcus wardiae TaxID=1814290 RepID=UPI001F10CAA4|nr:hypothetical protein [Nitrosococcus wardiae]
MIAILNGALRKAWYGKRLSELQAHQVSTVSGLLLFSLYIWALLCLWPLDSAQHAWIMGFTWLGLTVGFEFLFGHYVAKHSWRRLFHDYNVLAGRLWLLVPIWIMVAPYVFYRLGS